MISTAQSGETAQTPSSLPLPKVPQTNSPVPSLTSLHATDGRGPYGDPRYRGNCSGRFIKDLLMFYQPRSVFDPMEGGGTCGDVCRELGIDYTGRDLKTGHDAMNPESYGDLPKFDFIWMHPPYWNMIPYSEDVRCLSTASSVGAWAYRMRLVIRNCVSVLNPNGHMAVLIGDGKHQGRYMCKQRSENVAPGGLKT